MAALHLRWGLDGQQTGLFVVFSAGNPLASRPPFQLNLIRETEVSAHKRRRVTQGPGLARAGLYPEILTRSVLAFGCAPRAASGFSLTSPFSPCVPRRHGRIPHAEQVQLTEKEKTMREANKPAEKTTTAKATGAKVPFTEQGVKNH